MNLWIESLGQALLHFLWQGVIVGLIVYSLIKLFQIRSSNARYSIACAALLIMLAFPVITTIHIHTIKSQSAPVSESFAISSNVISTSSNIAANSSISSNDDEYKKPAGSNAWLIWMVAAWAVGSACLFIRLFGGWLVINRIRNEASVPNDPCLQKLFAHLVHTMQIGRSAVLLVSSAVQSPTVVGCFKYTIFWPASVATGISTQHIEMLLAHELAHIKRYDFLVNLIQSSIESLLFYHPAVWWVSQQIRQERENCCDDMVIDLLCDRRNYAYALTSLEFQRAGEPALRASGGKLLPRIKRILGENEMKSTPASAVLAAILAITLLTASASAFRLQSADKQPDASQAAAEKQAAEAVEKQRSESDILTQKKLEQEKYLSLQLKHIAEKKEQLARAEAVESSSKPLRAAKASQSVSDPVPQNKAAMKKELLKLRKEKAELLRRQEVLTRQLKMSRMQSDPAIANRALEDAKRAQKSANSEMLANKSLSEDILKDIQKQQKEALDIATSPEMKELQMSIQKQFMDKDFQNQIKEFTEKIQKEAMSKDFQEKMQKLGGDKDFQRQIKVFTEKIQKQFAGKEFQDKIKKLSQTDALRNKDLQKKLQDEIQQNVEKEKKEAEKDSDVDPAKK